MISQKGCRGCSDTGQGMSRKCGLTAAYGIDGVVMRAGTVRTILSYIPLAI